MNSINDKCVTFGEKMYHLILVTWNDYNEFRPNLHDYGDGNEFIFYVSTTKDKSVICIDLSTLKYDSYHIKVIYKGSHNYDLTFYSPIDGVTRMFYNLTKEKNSGDLYIVRDKDISDPMFGYTVYYDACNSIYFSYI